MKIQINHAKSYFKTDCVRRHYVSWFANRQYEKQNKQNTKLWNFLKGKLRISVNIYRYMNLTT